MERYTLIIDNGNGIEGIWTGNEINDALYYEAIAIKHWGKDIVWIYDNVDKIAVK